MKKIGWVAGVGLVAAVVAAAVIAVKIGFGKIRILFDGIDSQTGIILGVMAVVLLLCSLAVATAIRSAGRRTGESTRQNERARTYQALLASIANGDERGGDTAAPLAATLFLLGSAQVVQGYRTLAQMVSAGNASEAEVRKQINRLMLAMRRDIGESTFGLEQEDWLDWLQNPVSDKTSEPIKNGTTSVHRQEFIAPAVRLSNRA
jgi:hypothetical protein